MALASAINTADPVDGWWLTASIAGLQRDRRSDRSVGQKIIWGDNVLTGEPALRQQHRSGRATSSGAPTSCGTRASRLCSRRTSCGAPTTVWGGNMVWSRSRHRPDGRRQHRLGHGRRRQHRVGRARRRQHRLGHVRRATTSSGAPGTATTSSGARRDGDNIVWGTGRRRQHRLGHRPPATTSSGALRRPQGGLF